MTTATETTNTTAIISAIRNDRDAERAVKTLARSGLLTALQRGVTEVQAKATPSKVVQGWAKIFAAVHRDTGIDARTLLDKPPEEMTDDELRQVAQATEQALADLRAAMVPQIEGAAEPSVFD